jgi:hypothetical protein
MSKPKNSHGPKRRTKRITHNQTLPPHAAAPRVEGRKEPQGGAHAREAQRPLLAPDEDHGQDELPDEPNGEAQQQGLDERRLDREQAPEQGGDDPREDGHRDGGRRPHREDLGERVLPHVLVPCVLLLRRERHGAFSSRPRGSQGVAEGAAPIVHTGQHTWIATFGTSLKERIFSCCRGLVGCRHLPRTPFLRTRVNKGKKQGRGTYSIDPGPLVELPDSRSALAARLDALLRPGSATELSHQDVHGHVAPQRPDLLAL